MISSMPQPKKTGDSRWFSLPDRLARVAVGSEAAGTGATGLPRETPAAPAAEAPTSAYAALGPLLGWENLPELMRFLDE